MEHGYYMVRPMQQTEDQTNAFLQKNVVAVGWSEVDFSSFKNPNDLVNHLGKKYPAEATKPQAAGRAMAQVRRFKGISQGDRILVPLPGEVCLAEAQGEEIFDPASLDLDLANQRRVSYLRATGGQVLRIRRDSLSEGLQTRLRVPGTFVADLYEFHEEIEQRFQNPLLDWDANFSEEERKAEEEFKRQLLEKIQSGRTNLKAGGEGLERLVCELLEKEGYKAAVLGKREFPGAGDADVSAVRVDPFFGERQLLVQVKHHRGETGTWGEEQLEQIRRSPPEKYSDYDLVLCTSGSASEKLKELCDRNHIKLMDGEALAEWATHLLPKLDIKTRMTLGVSSVPRIHR